LAPWPTNWSSMRIARYSSAERGRQAQPRQTSWWRVPVPHDQAMATPLPAGPFLAQALPASIACMLAGAAARIGLRPRFIKLRDLTAGDRRCVPAPRPPSCAVRSRTRAGRDRRQSSTGSTDVLDDQGAGEGRHLPDVRNWSRSSTSRTVIPRYLCNTPGSTHSGQHAQTRLKGPCSADNSWVVFDLRRRDTGGLVHQYASEAAALAFIRDVVRIGGHEQAACFLLDEQDTQGKTQRIAEGAELVRRALQDRAP
jgi:hypothetical protein